MQKSKKTEKLVTLWFFCFFALTKCQFSKRSKKVGLIDATLDLLYIALFRIPLYVTKILIMAYPGDIIDLKSVEFLPEYNRWNGWYRKVWWQLLVKKISQGYAIDLKSAEYDYCELTSITTSNHHNVWMLTNLSVLEYHL
jgi:hypothetical protein